MEKRTQKGVEKLTDELAKSDQVQLIQNTDQCLAESLALATKESEERDSRTIREIKRLLNNQDNT